MAVFARLLAAVLLVAGAAVAPVLARGAAAGLVPDPIACYEVKPMGLLDMLDLVDDLDTQANQGNEVDTSVYGPSLATGPDADSMDRAAVQQTLDAFVACVNEREPQRLVSLLSERYAASLVLDLFGAGDAMSVIADRIPVIVRAEDAGDPIATPDIVRAWRPASQPTQVWAVVSGPIPGYETDVELFVAFEPSGEGWTIDLIASYEE